jgi:hypothetical protein
VSEQPAPEQPAPEFDEKLYRRGLERLKGAIRSLWGSGASWETIEDDIEDAQQEAGITPRAAEERSATKEPGEP